ncbi:MAG: twin-arginine translocase TatA/TatE family subunit [Spirochaetaceae bacterium]|nr:twin-arginine translocase TatA/TatE family subunit [Myxococcales bacterium]MCB9724028.1 twin-arginine translocase TatA/TatE family subunit [Spirochaetaceae bacterium]HPG24968.1 twin-arginine translocase TatA/TatE family subunit [Myxococcota bacterium]
MFGIGPTELVLILVVALLVFGPKRLPELARNLGRGLAEFRRASNDLRQTLALDDLQNDLKRDLKTGMDSLQTIHRPGDRPAQAGDDLPPAAGGPASASTAAGATEETSSGTATTAPHPGELPLDNDHEHHDVHEPGEDEESDGVSAVDSPLGNVPVTGRSPADPRRG